MPHENREVPCCAGGASTIAEISDKTRLKMGKGGVATGTPASYRRFKLSACLRLSLGFGACQLLLAKPGCPRRAAGLPCGRCRGRPVLLAGFNGKEQTRESPCISSPASWQQQLRSCWCPSAGKPGATTMTGVELPAQTKTYTPSKRLPLAQTIWPTSLQMSGLWLRLPVLWLCLPSLPVLRLRLQAIRLLRLRLEAGVSIGIGRGWDSGLSHSRGGAFT